MRLAEKSRSSIIEDRKKGLIKRRRLNEGGRRRGKGLRVLGRRVRRENFEADLVSSSRFWDISTTTAFEIPPAFPVREKLEGLFEV